jgi:outer membrane protein assembly factor BamB
LKLLARKRPFAVFASLTTVLLVSVFACRKLPVGHPPAAPSEPMGITNGGYNSTYEFSATTTDPDTDSVAIHFSWGDGASSEWSSWVASGETITMSHSWSSPGTYQVKAQAKDKPGSTSDWSAVHSLVIISTRAPNTPGAPTGPSSASKDSLCTFTTITTDPDGDGVSYRFDWGNGDSSAWTDWVPSGQPGAIHHAFGRAGTPNVRAQARDVNEALSAWSNPHQVTIPNPYPPTTPYLESLPLSGVIGETLSLAATSRDSADDSISVRFSWGDGDTSGWSDLVPSGQYAHLTHVYGDTGIHVVEAQAEDEDGATSEWSRGCSLYVWRAKWRYQTGGIIQSSPALAADGTVFVGSDSCLYAIDPNGTLRWRYQTGQYVYSSPALAADGTVYVGSGDSCLYAISPNGTLKWRYQTGSGVTSSPAIAMDGTVYVGSIDHYLYAIDPNGTLKWRYQTGGFVHSSPAIAADGTVYVGSDDGYLYAIDPNGTLKWRYQTGSSVASSPAIAYDGTVYIGTDGDSLSAIDPNGALKWHYRVYGGIRSSPAIAADGTVYIGGSDVCLYAIDQNGTPRWRYLTTYGGTSPTIAADGSVYVGSRFDGHLYVVGASGDLKRSYQIGRLWSSVALAADGTAYVGSWDGCLYAIEGNSPLADSPWPKFRHDSKNTGRVGGMR